MLLNNYVEWKDCIEKKCGIELTKSFINKRLEELNDINNAHTKEFIAKYGESYTAVIKGWFAQSYATAK